LRLFQNFGFWKSYPRFNRKTGLLDSFSKAIPKTNRVLGMAQFTFIFPLFFMFLACSLSSKQEPDKQVLMIERFFFRQRYFANETFDATIVRLNIVYTDETSEYITSGFTCEWAKDFSDIDWIPINHGDPMPIIPPDGWDIEEVFDVRFIYQGIKSSSNFVFVYPKEGYLNNNILTEPDPEKEIISVWDIFLKNSYFPDETFDATGACLLVRYDDKTFAYIASGFTLEYAVFAPADDNDLPSIKHGDPLPVMEQKLSKNFFVRADYQGMKGTLRLIGVREREPDGSEDP
jgi:hypothetical protein